MSKKIKFLYCDGANDKWYFHIELSNEKLKSLEDKYGKLEEGSELLYDTDLGITQNDFHENRGEEHDGFDHNTIEVFSLDVDENEIVTWKL